MLKYAFCLFLFWGLVSCQPSAPSLGPSTQDSLATALQASCGYALSSSAGGKRISWKNQIPIQLEIAEFPSEFREAVYEAARVWNQQSKLDLFAIHEAPSPYFQKRGDERNSIHWIQQWSLADHYQALTLTQYTGAVLHEADIIINGQKLWGLSSESLKDNQYHLQSLLIHELGHVLGLQHVRTTSVMWPELLPAVVRDQLTTEDLNHLYCEYSK